MPAFDQRGEGASSGQSNMMPRASQLSQTTLKDCEIGAFG
jgi:hypothetical protein